MGQPVKFFNRECFRAAGKGDIIPFRGLFKGFRADATLPDKSFQAVLYGFAALGKTGADNSAEQLLVFTPPVFFCPWRKFYDRGIDFGHGVEAFRGYGHANGRFKVCPAVNRKNAVILAAGLCAEPLCYFPLNNENGPFEAGAVFQYFYDDGGGDSIGNAAENDGRAAPGYFGKIHCEDILKQQSDRAVSGELALKYAEKIAVYFIADDPRAGCLQKKRQGAGAGPDFNNRVIGRQSRAGYGLFSAVAVNQEILAALPLGLYAELFDYLFCRENNGHGAILF